MAATGLAMISSASAAVESKREYRPLCEQLPGANVERLTALEPEGASLDDPTYRAWLDQQDVQAAADAMGEQLAKEPLAVGVVVDYDREVLILVADPAGSDDAIRAMAGRLQAAGERLINIETRLMCHSLAEVERDIEQVKELIRTTESTGTVAARYRYDIGRVEVSMSSASLHDDGGLGDAVQEALGASKVQLRESDGGLAAGARHNDTSPHWGGAGLGKQGFSPSCSAGFTVNYGSTSHRALATAGHCKDVITSPNGGVFSTNQYVGQYLGHDSVCSAQDPWVGCWDVLIIGAGTQQYENKLHVDPCCPSTRRVTTKSDPQSWHNICVSGQLTTARCGLTLTTSIFSVACIPAGPPVPPGQCSGFVNDVYEAARVGSTVFVFGDSGGPVYTRLSSSRAQVIGLGIGNFNGSHTVWFHPPGIVETALTGVTGVNITVATTDGAKDTW